MDNATTFRNGDDTSRGQSRLLHLGVLPRYAAAVGIVGVAFAARQALAGVLGSGFTYILFYPAVMVTGLLGGFGPSLLATALASLISIVWILPRGPLSTANAVSLVLFALMGVLMSLAAGLYRRGRLQAALDSLALKDSEARLRDALYAEQAARAEAEAANSSKSAFLASMSHELRTPLNGITGYLDLLEMEIYGGVSDEQRRALTRVRQNAQYLLSLINDVLNFAKLEAGRIEYDIRDVVVAGCIAEVLPVIETQLRAKGIACNVDVLPDVVVRADPEKLRQILLNLLSNAVKFTNPGGRVTVDTATRNGAARELVFIRISDTGVGIPRERQDVIFAPFVQVHRSLTNPTQGTGLGLAISRDLARAMGGDLRVRSLDGCGSTFTLSLPRGA
jgi:signal transduction histidine kinase